MTRSLTSREIIEIWELGQGQHPLERALTMLLPGWPEQTRADLAAHTIGKRDARLFDLREGTFGSQLQGFAECPKCSARLEFNMKVSEVRAAASTTEETETHTLSAGDWSVCLRLPNSFDLAALVEAPNVFTAKQQLVKRCLLQIRLNDRVATVDDLTEDMVAQIASSMAEADPRSETLMDLQCSVCGHCWQALLEIAEFFWTELSVRARWLLSEIAALARAYGWSESEILALSPQRRRTYMELAGL